MITAAGDTLPPPPGSEQRRQQALDALEVLDTPPDPVLDGLVRCASRLLDYPVALVSLIDGERQWFKAREGLALSETAREFAFCDHAIRGADLFEVADASQDPRFAANPLVTGAPHILAYAGMPLTVDGERIGTLCVIDTLPRRLDAAQAALLADLAQAVNAWFESRHEQQLLRAERLRSAERLELLGRLAEQAPGMLFQYRTEAGTAARFTYVSSQLRELFGLEPEAVQQDLRPFLASTHPQDRDRLRAALADAATRAVPWHLDFRVELPGRGTQWRSLRATPQRQPDGTLLWHGFVADSTGQVEMEQLRRDKLAAERASQEKSAFLSRVSHELRTPLNAMLGFTQLLQLDTEEPLAPRQRERVAHASHAAQLLLGLIDDVLDVSRMDQGARRLVMEPLGVHAVIINCLPMVAQMAAQAGVLLTFGAMHGSEAWLAQGEARALEQVLLNLLTNGIKYNRRGGTLSVHLRADLASVYIDVCDQGQGLDANQLGRLFRPFERLGAENSQVPGSGLGLVIARQLVESMGGTIRVQSDPGKGSTFTLRLRRSPAATARPAGAGLPRHITDMARRDGAAEGDVTLLYIEDDPVNALLVQEALRGQPGWRVLHAADGLTGLALAQTLQPTLVLSDINLPGLSGCEVVQALRRDPSVCGTVCIALSADAMDAQITAAMRAGFDDYWTKPLDLQTLPQRLADWLDTSAPISPVQRGARLPAQPVRRQHTLQPGTA